MEEDFWLRRVSNSDIDGFRVVLLLLCVFAEPLGDISCGGVGGEGEAVFPPKVEYSLTELGESIIPNILSLAQWGRLVGKKIE